MAERIEADVLVIGAGPTGLTAANLLADQGMRVALIEKHWGSGDEPRAISATDETLRVMQQIGIMPRLAPEMLMDTGARYYGRGGRILAEVRPGNPRLGQPGKSQFDQPVMEGLLLEAASERAGIELHFNTEATGIDPAPRRSHGHRGPPGRTKPRCLRRRRRGHRDRPFPRTGRPGNRAGYQCRLGHRLRRREKLRPA